MARTSTPSKSTPKKAADKATQAKPARARTTRKKSSKGQVPMSSRTIPMGEEDDAMHSRGGGTTAGAGFGRCGGRIMTSRLEQQLCDQLTRRGIAHSHTPRYFEVQFEDQQRAAYAPLMVLRGRGREGKTVILECLETLDRGLLKKISAFREQYGSEFYVVFVAPEEVLDELPLSAYDDATDTQHMNTLVSRLAE